MESPSSLLDTARQWLTAHWSYAGGGLQTLHELLGQVDAAAYERGRRAERERAIAVLEDVYIEETDGSEVSNAQRVVRACQEEIRALAEPRGERNDG